MEHWQCGEHESDVPYCHGLQPGQTVSITFPFGFTTMELQHIQRHRVDHLLDFRPVLIQEQAYT